MSPLLVVAAAVLAVLVVPGRRDRVPRGVVPRGVDRPPRTLPGVSARRQVATSYDVADAMVLLSLALRSGMGQQEALERVAGSDPGPVAADLFIVAAALRWGQSSRAAWGHVPDAWRPAALAWEVAERAGAAPAQLVEDASWRVRDAEDRRLQGAAARAGVGLVLPLGLAFLPAFACTAVVPVVLAIAHTVLGP